MQDGTYIQTLLSGSSGFKITFAANKSGCVLVMTQYGHMFYVYAATGGNASIEKLSASSITPTVSGRTVSIPTGEYNRGCFIVNAGNPHTDVTVSAY